MGNHTRARTAERIKTDSNRSSGMFFLRGAHAPRVPISAPSPKSSSETQYSKRCLPHFERPWGKYAVAFSTHERKKLTPSERDIVLRSAVCGHERGQYELYVAYVMLDHVHLLFEPQPKEIGAEGQSVFWSLSEILQGIKSSTAHRINKERGATGSVWEKESFDRLIRSETDLQEKFAYICRSPWDSNVAEQNEDYAWLWTQEMSGERTRLACRFRCPRRNHSSDAACSEKVRDGEAPSPAREGACAPQQEVSPA